MATEMITHVSDPGVRAPIGIIGGYGFYSLFDDAAESAFFRNVSARVGAITGPIRDGIAGVFKSRKAE